MAVLQPINPRPFNWMRFLSGSLAASSNRSAPSPPWISPQAGPYPRDFNLQIALDQKDPRLKPGMTAQITVIVDRIPNAIAIPGASLFSESLVRRWPMSWMDQNIANSRSRLAAEAAIASLSPAVYAPGIEWHCRILSQGFFGKGVRQHA